ncbi:WUSCHEL-related homeobox 11-like [Curcuma longa]|uniref:WUSCHEL-related homeobox 11-like n=1 Tax=Curcuma longa TaxID=136217 RepID=UPI003D9FA2D6
MSKDDRSNSTAGAATVRSRWAPKPEQILILESIFNSGMVNPPKDETVRIRMLLEKFGAVGDANVFYWFQNRRSRSRIRRRQRELLSASTTALPSAAPLPAASGFMHLDINNRCSSSSSSVSPPASSSSSGLAADEGGSVGGGGDDPFTVSQKTGPINPLWRSSSSDASHRMSNYHQPGHNLTVLINGVQWEVPRGPLDTRAMFGQNLLLVHSSGELLPVDECGILLQSLQMGESYFLAGELAGVEPSLGELASVGCDHGELAGVGLGLAELDRFGLDLAEFGEFGPDLTELGGFGLDLAKLVEVGLAWPSSLESGPTFGELIGVGANLAELANVGVNLVELVGVGLDLAELVSICSGLIEIVGIELGLAEFIGICVG